MSQENIKNNSQIHNQSENGQLGIQQEQQIQNKSFQQQHQQQQEHQQNFDHQENNEIGNEEIQNVIRDSQVQKEQQMISNKDNQTNQTNQDEQEDYLKQNSIQYLDDQDQHPIKNDQQYSSQSQSQILQLGTEGNEKYPENNQEQLSSGKNTNQDKYEDSTAQTNNNNNNNNNNNKIILNKDERELIMKQNSTGKVVISGRKTSRDRNIGSGDQQTPKKRLTIQRLSVKGGEEITEKQLYQMTDANEITKQSSNQQFEQQQQQQNYEVKKLRDQNEKLREELKSLSDKLSTVIEKNQKNISNSKARLVNQTSDQVLKQELNNAYKLIDTLQKDNKKLQSQVYDGGHFEKVMKLDNDLKSKDQELKILKKELELNKKLSKLNAASEEEKKELANRRKDEFNEKYVLKQKIKDLQDKLSEKDDKHNRQYREYLALSKEYNRLCENNNIKPNFNFNNNNTDESDNNQEKSSQQLFKMNRNSNLSKDIKSASNINKQPRRSESLRPIERTKIGSDQLNTDQNILTIQSQNQIGIDQEFSNIEFNEQNFYDLMQKARIYKKSKVTCEKKLNNEINDLRNILAQKNQEILDLKSQLLNRDRQSNNLQSQLNQIKRKKQNLTEQQSFNDLNHHDSNVSVDDNIYSIQAGQTNNSIQYATPMKQERTLPKKNILPSSNAKDHSRSPNQKTTLTSQDSNTGRKFKSNPPVGLLNQIQSSANRIKSPKKTLPYQIGKTDQINNNSPQQIGYDPQLSNNKRNNNNNNNNSNNSSRSPKRYGYSVSSSQTKNPMPQSATSSTSSKLNNQQQKPIKKNLLNQSVEEFDSYSPTRFQNDEKNQPNSSNILLQQSNLNKEEIINSQRNISPQQQVLIPLTLRDVVAGVETEDSYKFTDRITLKQNYHHKIIYVSVIYDEKGLIGIQCNYRLQKTTQIVQGDMHILNNQNQNIIQNDESQLADEFNIEENCEGDYLKYVQGQINTDTYQIVNLIFVTSKGYRKLLGLQSFNNDVNIQNFNMDISENEVPICMFGSLQKIYGENENVIGSSLTQLGFNVERDENLIEENIKAYYAEDDQVRTQFESNQREQEQKKKKNMNSSTQFIREDEQQIKTNSSQKGSMSNIQYINSHPDSIQNHTNQSSNLNDYENNNIIHDNILSQQESPHFNHIETQIRNNEQHPTSIHNPIKIINQLDDQQLDHDNQNQNNNHLNNQHLSNSNLQNHHSSQQSLDLNHNNQIQSPHPQIKVNIINSSDSQNIQKESHLKNNSTQVEQQLNKMDNSQIQKSQHSLKSKNDLSISQQIDNEINQITQEQQQNNVDQQLLNDQNKLNQPYENINKQSSRQSRHDSQAQVLESKSRNSNSPQRNIQEGHLLFVNKLHTDISHNTDKNHSSLSHQQGENLDKPLSERQKQSQQSNRSQKQEKQLIKDNSQNEFIN